MGADTSGIGCESEGIGRGMLMEAALDGLIYDFRGIEAVYDGSEGNIHVSK